MAWPEPAYFQSMTVLHHLYIHAAIIMAKQEDMLLPLETQRLRHKPLHPYQLPLIWAVCSGRVRNKYFLLTLLLSVYCSSLETMNCATGAVDRLYQTSCRTASLLLTLAGKSGSTINTSLTLPALPLPAADCQNRNILSCGNNRAILLGTRLGIAWDTISSEVVLWAKVRNLPLARPDEPQLAFHRGLKSHGISRIV